MRWSTGVVRSNGITVAGRPMVAGTWLCTVATAVKLRFEDMYGDTTTTNAELPSGDVVEVLPGQSVALLPGGWISATPIGVFNTGAVANVGIITITNGDNIGFGNDSVPGLEQGISILTFETMTDVDAGDPLTIVPFHTSSDVFDRRRLSDLHGKHLMEHVGINTTIPLQHPDVLGNMQAKCDVMDTAFSEALNNLKNLVCEQRNPSASCGVVFHTVSFMLKKMWLPDLEPLLGAPSTPSGIFVFAALHSAWERLPTSPSTKSDSSEMREMSHAFLLSLFDKLEADDETPAPVGFDMCNNLIHLRLVIMMQTLLRTWLSVFTRDYLNAYVTDEREREHVNKCIMGGRALLVWTIRYVISWVNTYAACQPRHELLYSMLMLGEKLRHTQIEMWSLLMATPEWEAWRNKHVKVGAGLDNHTKFVLNLVRTLASQ